MFIHVISWKCFDNSIKHQCVTGKTVSHSLRYTISALILYQTNCIVFGFKLLDFVNNNRITNSIEILRLALVFITWISIQILIQLNMSVFNILLFETKIGSLIDNKFINGICIFFVFIVVLLNYASFQCKRYDNIFSNSISFYFNFFTIFSASISSSVEELEHFSTFYQKILCSNRETFIEAIAAICDCVILLLIIAWKLKTIVGKYFGVFGCAHGMYRRMAATDCCTHCQWSFRCSCAIDWWH